MKREKVPKLRVSLGKQVSEISFPHRFLATDIKILPPELWDVSNALVFSDIEYFRGGEARVQQPSYDVASMDIPLQADISAVELSPTTNLVFLTVDVILDQINIELFDSQIIHNLSVPNILLVPLTFEKISIFGMNYADRHWHKISYSEEDISRQPKQSKSDKQQREGVFVEPKKRGRKPKNQQPLPTIWDLLFAILQPPLAFGEMESLSLPDKIPDYQWQGIKFLMDNEHALLADDMGTGKTIMTIVALKILVQQAKVHNILVLCPLSVLYQWKEELEKWASELTSYIIRNPQRDVRKSLWNTPMHIYITTYDTYRSDVENDVFPKEKSSFFDVVILDEAHHVKNAKTKSSRAIKKLQPRRRWALTGTPIQNKIEDLASIFEFVYPGYLTSFDLRSEQIQSRIKSYFLRRRKKDVMPELLPKIYAPIELELDEDQDIAYRLEEAGIRSEFDNILARGEKVTKQHIFAKLAKLKQICNFAPRKFTSPKTDFLKEQIEEIIEGGNKVIVFSQYINEGVSKIEKILEPYGFAKIVGGQSDAIRRSEIENFKKRKEIPILLASVRSGGEGLNLTEASYVVHFDHWWNPAVMWQAEDRVHRRGQTKGVNIYSYWMKDTIDDRIRQKLREKNILFEQVIDGLAEDQIEEYISTDEWLEILGVKKMEIAKKPIAETSIWQSMSLSEIREKLYEISPADFEGLVRELMHYLGYPNVKITGKSHDGGIDVLSTRNIESGIERVAAQCKRYHQNVSVHSARDFFGAISNDKSIKLGFLVTTGEFTNECLQFCQSSGMIRAISGIELAKYVKQFGLQA